MTKTRKTILISLISLLMTAFWGIAYAQDMSTVQTASKEGLGTFLVDSKGMTLYYFTKDSAGKSACVEACLQKWLVFFTEKITVAKGLKEKDFGSITREDGKKQITFKGYPLYYFFKDKQAGDAFGQGVNNVWYVIDPAKFNPKTKK